jgi:Tol biopolymer transport system component
MNRSAKIWRRLARVAKWIFLALGVIKALEIIFALWFFSSYPKPPLLSEADERKSERIGLAGLSRNGNELYFERAIKGQKPMIGKVDLTTNEGTLYSAIAQDDQLTSPGVSTDDKRLVVAIRDKASNYELSQIGVVDLGTSTYRVVTKKQSYKQFPSFSPDGKKIIYGQANRLRSSGRTRFSNWDIYETEIETRVERRLTDFCFYAISPPHYFQSSDKFVFAGEHPRCNSDDSVTNASSKMATRLTSRSAIFLFGTDEQNAFKPFVVVGDESLAPVVSSDGRIFFISKTNELDGLKTGYYNYDIFVHDHGGVKRLTNLKSYISSFVVSADGSKLVFGSDKERSRDVVYWILDVRQGTYRKLQLGDFHFYKTVALAKVN